jgi:hypothetical protein
MTSIAGHLVCGIKDRRHLSIRKIDEFSFPAASARKDPLEWSQIAAPWR